MWKNPYSSQWNAGKKHSEESKLKMIEKPIGTGKTTLRGMTGKHHTEESKKKMSESQKRRFDAFPDSNGWRGKIHNEETKKKMSIQHRKEGLFLKKIRSKYDALFDPRAICDAIGIKNGILYFIELKNQETHDILTERQARFKNKIESLKLKNILYEIIPFLIQEEEILS